MRPEIHHRLRIAPYFPHACLVHMISRISILKQYRFEIEISEPGVLARAGC